MAKKNYKKKKLTFRDILKGNFLNREEVRAYGPYFMMVIMMFLIIIYANHLVNRKIKIIHTLQEQAEEYKSRNAYAQSKLIKIKLESELTTEVVKDSLIPLENHPHKLLIKVDNADNK
ncbi:FtsL-like putative cell division protein [Riemerella columbipharyngis]|uniref:Cell division protein FtsL n=1 Tax=Riemerella columbipharyngis TaxID=1071918 RepID=A0A1G7F532_9FLAO|nr:FtsL-like putative cell division protein [Riemerella columbipharyngis]SDE71040.1 hypothetical protein SAMN05421544_11927 [Riemerella columbipharyngis]